MRHFPIGLLLLSVLFLPALVFAQSTTGVIEGVVSDASGAALPGVTVTLRNVETNYTHTLVTDSAGRYRGVLLPLGRYDVSATLSGFATRVSRGHQLAVGQTLTADVTLTTAAVEESIVVTAEVPLIETARTE